ncbi:MAG: hypothetical protein HC884_16085 [Chloroflexaceae bacterium]|nr:hypothetical protein [Chloroflexaceae bacterium]
MAQPLPTGGAAARGPVRSSALMDGLPEPGQGETERGIAAGFLRVEVVGPEEEVGRAVVGAEREGAAANISDGAGARGCWPMPVLAGSCSAKSGWTRQTYRGDLADWMAQDGYPTELEIVACPPGQKRFQVRPRQWVAEQSFAWLTFNRELVRDYAYDPRSSEAWITLASIRLMLRRLTGAADDPMACNSN